MQATTHQIYVPALIGYMAKFQILEQLDGVNGPYLLPDRYRKQVLVGGHEPGLEVSTRL